jgi:hypothetical protein
VEIRLDNDRARPQFEKVNECLCATTSPRRQVRIDDAPLTSGGLAGASSFRLISVSFFRRSLKIAE